jgi:anti-sigma factor ChrR (cupin superfamily)
MRAPERLVPTADGSTYVKPQEMEWKPTQFEGISIKVLYEEPSKGEMTCLLRWVPGARLPIHKHTDIEQTWVLEGSFCDDAGVARAGEFVWRAAGSVHEARTEEGAVILAIFRKPNVFQKSSGFDL